MDYKAHVSEVFDRSAPAYGGFGNHYFDIFAERLVKLAQGFQGASVLDVATGPGSILKQVLPQIGKEGRIVGIDLSPKMIEEARKQIRAENAALHCMDAEALDFEDRSFDLIYCGFALFFFPNIKQTMLEFKRVLKPDGKIAVSTWGEMGKPRHVLKERLASFGVDSSLTAYPMPSQEELGILFAEAGFQSVEIVPDRLDHRYANFDHWMECLWQHGPRSALEKLNEEQLQILKQQLCEELEDENRPDGFHDELNVFYTIASLR